MRRVRLYCVLMAAFVLACGSGVTMAGVIFEDSFEYAPAAGNEYEGLQYSEIQADGWNPYPSSNYMELHKVNGNIGVVYPGRVSGNGDNYISLRGWAPTSFCLYRNDLALAEGVTYTVSMLVSSNYSKGYNTGTVHVLLGGQKKVYDLSLIGREEWTEISFDFTLSAADITAYGGNLLQMGYDKTNDNHGSVCFDALTVTQIPEPVSLLLLLAAAPSVLIKRRNR